jgi:hypothetical protein
VSLYKKSFEEMLRRYGFDPATLVKKPNESPSEKPAE